MNICFIPEILMCLIVECLWWNTMKINKMFRNKFNQGGERSLHWKLWSKKLKRTQINGKIACVCRSEHCQKIHTTQCHLQNQHNPNQNFSGIFHRNQKNNAKICMETQKTLNNKNNLEKKITKLEVSCSLISNYISKIE